MYTFTYCFKFWNVDSVTSLYQVEADSKMGSVTHQLRPYVCPLHTINAPIGIHADHDYYQRSLLVSAIRISPRLPSQTHQPIPSQTHLLSPLAMNSPLSLVVVFVAVTALLHPQQRTLSTRQTSVPSRTASQYPHTSDLPSQSQPSTPLTRLLDLPFRATARFVMASDTEHRQRIESLLTLRKNEDTPPVPWHLIAASTDDNPFLGYTLNEWYRSWCNPPFQKLVDKMYQKKQPGTGPLQSHALKEPDTPHRSPTELVSQ